MGFTVKALDLEETIISSYLLHNPCRRQGGDHHLWWVYIARDYSGQLRPDKDETDGAAFYTKDEVAKLAKRTKDLRQGNISQEEFDENPGLEEVWLDMLPLLGL